MSFKYVSPYQKYFGFFKPFIGATLQSLAFEQYYFNGEASGDSIGSLEFKFHSVGHLLLSLGSDGETVTASHDQLSITGGFNLDDGSRCDWSRKEYNGGFIGQRLRAVNAQIEHMGGNSAPFTSGWIMIFDSIFLGYYNLGDEAYLMCNKSPPISDPLIRTIELVAGSMVI